VENEHQLEMGLKSGAFSKDTVVNISGAHYRICAPTISIDVKSCIFWTKEYLADDKPTTDKIVSSYCVFVKPLNCLKFGATVYNVSQLCKIFGSDRNVIQDEVIANLQAVV
jgi:hypothetical protein